MPARRVVLRATTCAMLVLTSACSLLQIQLGPKGTRSAQAASNPAPAPDEVALLESRGDFAGALAKRDERIAELSARLGPGNAEVTAELLRAAKIAIDPLGDRGRAHQYLSRVVLPTTPSSALERLTRTMMAGDAHLYMERALVHSMLGQIAESDADIARGRQLGDAQSDLTDIYGQMRLMVRMDQAAVYMQREDRVRALQTLDDGRVNVFSLLATSRLKHQLGDVEGAVLDAELAAEGLLHDLERVVTGKHRSDPAEVAKLVGVLATHQSQALSLALAHPEHAGARQVALWASSMLQGQTYDSQRYERPSWFGAREEALATELIEARAELAARFLTSLAPEGRGQIDPASSERVRELETAMREKGNAKVGENASSPAELRASAKMFLAAAERGEFPRGAAKRFQQSVQARLAAASAVVSFVRFTPLDLADLRGVYPGQAGSARYVALVLRPSTDAPQLVDLGEAGPIDEAVLALQGLLRDPQVPLAAVQGAADGVRTSVWSPIASTLGATAHAYVIPDGALQLVPMSALYDAEHGAWLDESLGVSYLDSSRQLLFASAQGPATTTPVVLAAPLAPGGSYAYRGLSAEGFPSLPGADAEAKSVGAAMRARVLSGAEANEVALRSLHRPRVLHVASHALVFADAPLPEGDDGQRGFRPAAAPPATGSASVMDEAVEADDLLRTAIVLSPPPANGASKACCDSFVTAYELAAMDLRGTELVTLSACQTGLGKQAGSHGVASLRRALAMAGAKSVVASLWQVSDASTSALMSRFYAELAGGSSRLEALQRAMADVRTQHPHPYHWAPFTLSGASAAEGQLQIR